MTNKTITAAYPSGFTLASKYSYLYIEHSASVGGTGVFVTGDSGVVNYGTVRATGDGVYLNASDGYVVNQFDGTIYGNVGVKSKSGATGVVVENRHLLSGYTYAVELQSGGEVDNSGTLSAFNAGIFANSGYTRVLNDGSIGGFFGVDLGGTGAVFNGGADYTNARIAGSGVNVAIAGVGTVDNFGTIYGYDEASGVDMIGGGTVVNGTTLDTKAMIEGSLAVRVSGGTVSNFATIQSNGEEDGFGVRLNGSGDLTNGAALDRGALVLAMGTDPGVLGYGGTVTNYGTIRSDYGYGEQLRGGILVNGPGGDTVAVVRGMIAVDAIEYAATISNFAILEGATSKGGIGAYLDSGSIYNGTGSVRTALIEGYDGVSLGAGGQLRNFGTVLGQGGATSAAVGGSDGGYIDNGSVTDTAARIDGYTGISISGAAGQVVNYGTVAGEGDFGNPAIALVYGGTVANGDGADASAMIIGVTGVYLGQAGSLSNFGTINGLAGYGVLMEAGGQLSNGLGLSQSALIEGVIGIEAHGVATIHNSGTVISTQSAHYGVGLGDGGLLVNGSATNAHALIEGYSGVGIEGDGVVDNFGTLSGAGDTGGFGLDVAASGYGQVVNGSSIHAGALIEGYTGVVDFGTATITNWGIIDGLGGVAVELENKSAILAVETGATFIGSVTGGGGTIDLASGTGTITSLLVGGIVTESGSTTTFTNFGALEIGAGTDFTAVGNNTLAAGQGLIVAGALVESGTLSLTGGPLTLRTGADLDVSKVVQSAGTANVADSSLTLSHVWDQTGGTLTVATGCKAIFTATGDVFDGTLAGAGTVEFTNGSDTLSGTHLTATSVVISGASVTLSGAISLTDTVSVTSPDLTIAAAGATLSGAGAISLSTNTTNEIIGGPLTNATKIVGTGTIAVSSLTNSGTIQASSADALTIDIGAATVINSGIIENTSTGGLTVDQAVNNTGTLEATKGTLTVGGAVTGAGKVLLNGGAVDLAGAFSGAVSYTATGGTLVLAHSRTDTVTITGFPKTSVGSIDLQDINFSGATVTYSGTTTSGTLTIKNGAAVATFTLEGNYTTSTFTLANDGSNHVLVTDPTGPTKPPTTVLPLATAMAAMGAGTGLSHGSTAPAKADMFLLPTR